MSTKTILCIDDDEGFLFFLSAVLKRIDPNVNVLTARDGQEALDVLEKIDENPNMMFVDINMSGMDGHEFFKEYAPIYSEADTQIFVLSSSEHETDRKLLSQYDFIDGYLIKPVFEEDLKPHLDRMNTAA